MGKENVVSIQMEFVIKKYTFKTFVGKWMHLENILSEIQEVHIFKYCKFYFI